MNALFQYLIQSSLSIAVFYGIYWLFLRRDTFFTINRFFLTGSLVFSLMLPLINFTGFLSSVERSYFILLDPVTITASEISQAVVAHLSTFEVILIVYLTGVVIFFVRFIIQLVQLYMMIRTYGITRRDGAKFVFIDRKYSPFSFFNLIFIQSMDADGEKTKNIISHELIHIRQMHSLDLLLLEFVTILMWFNPFIWFYRYSLKSVHEYLADEGVLAKGINKLTYQDSLLEQSIGIQVNDLTNNFNHSLIKRRFVMMTKVKSNHLAKLKLALVLPMAGTLVFFIAASTTVLAQEENPVPPPKSEKIVLNESGTVPPPPKAEKIADGEKVPPPPPKAQGEKKVYRVVEKMPEFPGGKEAMINYVIQNIKYPESARKIGLQGTVYVSYIVNKDGKISDVNVMKFKSDMAENEKTKEGIEAMKKEAHRVMQGMPDWKPGYQDGEPVNVQMVLPVKFNLDDKEKKSS